MSGPATVNIRPNQRSFKREFIAGYFPAEPIPLSIDEFTTEITSEMYSARQIGASRLMAAEGVVSPSIVVAVEKVGLVCTFVAGS